MCKTVLPYPQKYQHIKEFMSTSDPSPFSRVQKFLANNEGYTFTYISETGRELTITPYADDNDILFTDCDYLLNCSGELYKSLLSVLITAVEEWESKNANQKTPVFSDYLSELKDLNAMAQVAIGDRLRVEPEPEFIKTVQERLKDDSVKNVCTKSCEPQSLENDKIAELEKTIVELNLKVECYDKALDLDNDAIAGLNTKIEELEKTISDLICLQYSFVPRLSRVESSVKNSTIEHDPVDPSVFTPVVHLTHSDRSYEAFWRENHGSFYVCEVGSDGDLCSVGNVSVQKDKAWDDKIFLSVSRSVISAYLDGLNSYHNNRF